MATDSPPEEPVQPSKLDLLKQEIFSDASKPALLTIKEIDELFPKLKGKIFVKIMDMEGKLACDVASRAAGYEIVNEGFLNALVLHSACNEDGDRIFSDKDKSWIETANPLFKRAIWRESVYLNDYLRKSATETASD